MLDLFNKEIMAKRPKKEIFNRVYRFQKEGDMTRSHQPKATVYGVLHCSSSQVFQIFQRDQCKSYC